MKIPERHITENLKRYVATNWSVCVEYFLGTKQLSFCHLSIGRGGCGCHFRGLGCTGPSGLQVSSGREGHHSKWNKQEDSFSA